MFKPAIFITISIASLLSIPTVTNARLINNKSLDDSGIIKPYLIVKQIQLANNSNTIISKSDLSSIQLAITEYYHEINKNYLPSNILKTQTSIGEVNFFEVQNYSKLIYLGKGRGTLEGASVELLVQRRVYSADLRRDSNNNPIASSFKKTESYRYKVIIELERGPQESEGRNRGKWKVSQEKLVDKSAVKIEEF